MGYLGIDLGTTNSVAVIYNDITNTLDTVKIDGIDEILPSVVNFLDDEVIIGQEAKDSAIIYPETTISSVKKLMGRGEPIIIGDKSYEPSFVSSKILQKLKEEAENMSGETFDEVVITHPAYFNDAQIFDTKKAGELAGFKKTYLLSEPLAAAIEYGYKEGHSQTILVYDLGGGTFDACVLKVTLDDNNEEQFKELSDVGDMNLGGDDFDFELVEYMKNRFNEENNFDVDTLEGVERKRVIQKLKQEAEQIKKKLSQSQTCQININPLVVYEGVPKNLSFEITRDEFETMIKKYIDRSKEIVLEALNRASKEVEDISKVILVGGSSLIPMVRRMVSGVIKEPYQATDPAKSVAMGAAIYNYLMHLPSSTAQVLQITRQIIGTEAITDVKSMERKLFPIIPMGENIPCEFKDDRFQSYSQNVGLNIFQWEKGYEDEKKFIGRIDFEGVSKNAKIEVTYKIDENNIFTASLTDTSTGKTVNSAFDRTKSKEYVEETSKSLSYEKINVVFLIDTTGSMDNYISGVKNKANEFANIIRSKGLDFELGLIGFGDLNEKEKPTVYKFTDDVERFIKQVNKIPRTYGGDIPESSLDSLETGIELLSTIEKNDDNKNIFILITDAPPHIPTNSGKSVEQIKDMLYSNNVTTYVACGRDKVSTDSFSKICENGGKIYDMRQNFNDILDNIARSITELVRI